MDLSLLPRPVKAELRGLPSDLADVIAAHLVAAGLLIDEDPQLAYRHAEAARRRASRLAIVREAAAETAYAAGEYAEALSEFRALRRMSGSDEYLHVMADCERALGKPEAALKLIREAQRHRLDDAQAVELRLVEAGVREDMGQRAEAMRLLKTSIEEFVDGPPVAQARLRFAYAEALLARGREDQARKWLETAIRLDPADESGAADRLSELDGLVLELGDDEDDEDDELQGEDPDGDDSVETDEAGEVDGDVSEEDVEGLPLAPLAQPAEVSDVAESAPESEDAEPAEVSDDTEPAEEPVDRPADEIGGEESSER